MRSLALLLCASTLAACLPPAKPRMDPVTKLLVRRAELADHQQLAVIGMVIGVTAGIIGGVLLKQGIDARASEATADTEGGLGELLFGTMLTGTGILVTGASGISLGVSSHEIAEIDARLRRLDHRR